MTKTRRTKKKGGASKNAKSSSADADAQTAPLRASPSSDVIHESIAASTSTKPVKRRGQRYALQNLGKNVVRIYATVSEPDYALPWQRLPPIDCSGSGVVVLFCGRKCILTAAHVVADATSVSIMTSLSANIKTARILGLQNECDLALLYVPERHLRGIKPAPLATMQDIHLRSKVLCVGFPIGGEELSVTSGVVSRIETTEYAQSGVELLAITIDASINEGNSGGPVFSASRGGELVGIAFQALEQAELIGHVIPPPVIRHFLTDLASSPSRVPKGFPDLGVTSQPLTNPYIRKYSGIAGMRRGDALSEAADSGDDQDDAEADAEAQSGTDAFFAFDDDDGMDELMDQHDNIDEELSGVLITDVAYGTSAYSVLQSKDIILAIDGVTVHNNGTVNMSYGRVDFSVVYKRKQCGDKLKVRVLRNGGVLELDVVLAPSNHLVRPVQYGVPPQYFIYAGLVFMPLTVGVLELYEADDTPAHLEVMLENGKVSEKRSECVLLRDVLTDNALNHGYEDMIESIVEKCNDVEVSSLAHLVTLIEQSTAEVVLHTDHKRIIVLPSPSDARTHQRRILQRYYVAVDRSADMPGTPIPATELKGSRSGRKHH